MWIFEVLAVAAAVYLYGEWMLLRTVRAMSVRSVAHLQAIRAMSLECQVTRKATEELVAGEEAARLELAGRLQQVRTDGAALLKIVSGVAEFQMKQKAWMGDELTSMENRLTNVLTERARAKDTASRVLRPKTGTQFRNMVENASETEGTDANRA